MTYYAVGGEEIAFLAQIIGRMPTRDGYIAWQLIGWITSEDAHREVSLPDGAEPSRVRVDVQAGMQTGMPAGNHGR
jgi:hypothetical protein